MNKILGILFVVALVLVSFGCASKPKEVLGAEGIPRPQWVADMALEDPVLHYEIGFGKGTNRASSMARAESDARNKIAFWVKTDVEKVLKNILSKHLVLQMSIFHRSKVLTHKSSVHIQSIIILSYKASCLLLKKERRKASAWLPWHPAL